MMRSNATDIQVKPIGKLTLMYLKECGYSDEKIASWTSRTRLLHDIGLSGDDVLDEFKILQDRFGVDLSGFDLGKYFPTELSTEAFLLALRSLLRKLGLQRIIDGIYDKYPEVTLEMIESAIAQKRWITQ